MNNRIKRVANDFLSNGVIGKFNQYCGVKCIIVDNNPYLLEGDQADGYCLFTISQRVLESASGEVCEAFNKGYIEIVAINEFYRVDGSGYLRYNTEDFTRTNDRKSIDKVKEFCRRKYQKEIPIC